MHMRPRNRTRGRGRADPKKRTEAIAPDPDDHMSWTREVVAGEGREIAREVGCGLICWEARGHRCGYRPKCRAVSIRTARGSR